MTCRKCGIELSERVCKIHESRCNIKKEEIKQEINKPVKAEDLNIKQDEYTLAGLLQMCIDNQNIKFPPSTIKRWKEPRAIKELGI